MINRDLLDKMLRLFHCLLFPFRASKKKMEIRVGGGFFKLGNPGGRGFLAVWEIQSEGGVKNACHPSGGVYFFWNNPIHRFCEVYCLHLQTCKGPNFFYKSAFWSSNMENHFNAMLREVAKRSNTVVQHDVG